MSKSISQQAKKSKNAVSVDGFNFYYGALKNRPYCKWINLVRLDERKCFPQSSLIAFILILAPGENPWWKSEKNSGASAGLKQCCPAGRNASDSR